MFNLNELTESFTDVDARQTHFSIFQDVFTLQHKNLSKLH